MARSKRRQIFGTALVFVIAWVASATAEVLISPPGSGPGQSSNPQGLAVNPATGSLYVADAGNNRVNVFDSSGAFIKSFGTEGTAGGQFNDPTDIAIGESGNVYVLDEGNRRVEKFDSSGKFLRAFGGGVDQTTGADVCVAGSGDICGPGSKGEAAGEFNEGPRLAVSLNGHIYVADRTKTGFSELEGKEQWRNRLQSYEPSGEVIASTILTEGAPKMSLITADSSGSLYVAFQQTSELRKYSPAMSLLWSAQELAVMGLAVDLEGASEDLFVANQTGVDHGSPLANNIVEYSPGGEPLRRFGYGEVSSKTAGLAVHKNANGDIYISDPSGVRQLTIPPPGPIVAPEPCVVGPLGNISATITCHVNSEGKPTTIHFEYVDQAGFEAGGWSSSDVQQSPESESIGSDFDLHNAKATIPGLTPETVYHYRVVASNEDAARVVGEEGTFETKPAIELGPSFASDVTDEAAQLNAELNPLGITTTGFLELVDDATYQAEGFAGAQTTETIGFGSGEEMVQKGVLVTGLAPDTTYHFRLVAQDFLEGSSSPFKTVVGEERTFRTRKTFIPTLPDGRAYEQVSPPQKESGEVGGGNVASGLISLGYLGIVQSRIDGSAISYASFTAFADPESAPGASQYLSERTSGGWATRNITPVNQGGNPTQPPYRGFTSDLTYGAVAVREPPLAPDASSDFQNLYLRSTGTGSYQLVSGSGPTFAPGEEGYCVGYAGASADGSHVIFVANGALTSNAPESPGFSLYEWSASGGLKLVSVLPEGTPAPPAPTSANSAFGAKGGECTVSEKMLLHAISDDGSKVFWTFVPSSGETRLFARLGGTQTVQLDSKQGGVGPSGGGVFQRATGDGSVVFFTDTNRLVPGASTASPSSAGDLYRYDFSQPAGSRLVDVSKDPTPGSEPPDVLGVVAAGENGADVYFVANGILAPGAIEGDCSGESGRCNFYRWSQGGGVEFIATVTGKDSGDWNSKPRQQTARVTPDGQHLLFLSSESLTGYDNTIAGAPGCEVGNDRILEGSKACQEAYLYDPATGSLDCVSCNPTGARPTGPTYLPTWRSPYQQPRYLSGDGQRAFFETLSRLSPADTNDRRDVYEFERPGTGSCNEASPTFSGESNGCLFLISGGTSDDESYFLDASGDGGDAFFSTRLRLVGWDKDERYDVYDARVGGGFPEPPPASVPCGSEEGCRPPAPAPPAPSPSATSGASGEGNVKPHRRKHRRHKHRHHRRHGKHRSGKGRAR